MMPNDNFLCSGAYLRHALELENFSAGTPMEEFEKALLELDDETAARYRGYLNDFCSQMSTTPQRLHDLALKWSRSDKTAERLSMKKAWIAYYNGLIAEGVHANTAGTKKNGINKFLDANGLPKIRGGNKGVAYRGQDTIRAEEVRRVLGLRMSERLRALVLTLDQSGVRCSDAVQFTVEDFRMARQEIRRGKRFRTWREPLISEKTGIAVPVCLGPEAIEAIENYVKNRQSGHIFLREKGMFHWTPGENGKRIRTGERTEKGSPMSRKNVTMAVWGLVRPLREEGLKVSAHSFRKRFLDDWRRDRDLYTGKYIAGKKINSNDGAYMDIERDYFEKYIAHYFEYISLDQTDTEIEHLNEKIKTLEAQLRQREATQLSDEEVGGLRRLLAEVRAEKAHVR